ncbi:hypothetical protein L6452_20915 [Arctium lappa]|uniref:Uncharacterized protein n=1 Tax=Arctium lappa TaxID=4217 RepID=A0ACB9BDI7_ARCLA|nr:hypothetical protein L6452_20915 [Arctium lappa]
MLEESRGHRRCLCGTVAKWQNTDTERDVHGGFETMEGACGTKSSNVQLIIFNQHLLEIRYVADGGFKWLKPVDSGYIVRLVWFAARKLQFGLVFSCCSIAASVAFSSRERL